MKIEVVSKEHKTTWIADDGAGRISAWDGEVPAGLNGEDIGVIGEFCAVSKYMALELLGYAIEYLERAKKDYIIGPMNQNTWHSYRFLQATNREVPFFLEPSQPEEYVEWFQEAGFTAHQHYFSFTTQLENFKRNQMDVVAEFRERGVLLQNAKDISEQKILEDNFKLSQVCFAHNYYYTPISYEEYEAIYQPILSFLKKEFLYYAYVDGKPVAFLLGVPDYKEDKPVHILFKTFAVLPEYRNKGIAKALMECVADEAKKLQYTDGIMALVHEENHTMHMLPNQEMCSHYVLYRRKCNERFY